MIARRPGQGGTRSRGSIALLIGALIAIGSGGPALAEERPERDAERPGLSRKNRERWRELDREERKRLRELYRSLPAGKREEVLRTLRAMSPEERRRAIRRARARLERAPEERHVERIRRRLLREALRRLSPEERRRLEQLSPAERRRYLMERVRDQRRKLLADLEAPLRAAVRDLPPAEQARFLRRHLTIRAARETFTDLDEVERLRRLDRRRVVSALLGRPRGGRRSPKETPSEDAPPVRPRFLSEETWRRWQALEPWERPLVLRLVLARRPWPPEPPRPARLSGKDEPDGSGDGEPRPRRRSGGVEDDRDRREKRDAGGPATPLRTPRRPSSDRRSDQK